MSEESPPPKRAYRALREQEKAVLIKLAGFSLPELENCLVEDMNDGGMGSIRFAPVEEQSRSFGETIAQAEFYDTDGTMVSICVNVDNHGRLYELDFWKVDFSPLKQYPNADQLKQVKMGA